MARRRRKPKLNLRRFVLYVRADDPDNEALIADLEYAQQFNRCSKRLEMLARRGLEAEQEGSQRPSPPAPDDETKWHLRRDRPSQTQALTASEPPPVDGKDDLARATNNFLNAFGK